MKLHVFLLGWSISIAGTVLLLFVLYLVRHVTVEGFTVERGGGRQRWDSTKTPVSAISGTEVGQGSKPVLTPRLALA